MKPGIGQLLLALANTVATRILPELDEQSYATGDARMTALLSILLAQETDRAADTLWRENREMRALFLAASRQNLIPSLRVRLAHDAALEETDLKISTLSAAHDRYSETLMALQVAVEALDEDWAREFNREIWKFLVESAERRCLQMPAM